MFDEANCLWMPWWQERWLLKCPCWFNMCPPKIIIFNYVRRSARYSYNFAPSRKRRQPSRPPTYPRSGSGWPPPKSGLGNWKSWFAKSMRTTPWVSCRFPWPRRNRKNCGRRRNARTDFTRTTWAARQTASRRNGKNATTPTVKPRWRKSFIPNWF